MSDLLDVLSTQSVAETAGHGFTVVGIGRHELHLDQLMMVNGQFGFRDYRIRQATRTRLDDGMQMMRRGPQDLPLRRTQGFHR
nr:hypothetical protein [Abyssibacter sp.]